MNDATPTTNRTDSPRGEDTRAQLLDAGTRLFAIRGYDGVTTRQLANEAGVNVAAIAYHFGGKREFYRAVLAQLVADTNPMFLPAVSALRGGIASAHGDKTVLARLAANLVANFIRGFITYPAMRWRSALVLKEYAHPSEDFDILYRGRIEPLHGAMTELAAAALGLDPADPRAAMQAHAVMGQIVVFGVARIVLLKRLEWDDLTPERVATVIEVATASVLGSLHLPHPGRAEGHAPDEAPEAAS